MTDTWAIPKPLGYAAAVAAAIVSIGGAWKLLDAPVPATRGWVEHSLTPFRDDSLTLLQVRRQLHHAELFQWESNPVKNDHIRLNIERLKAEIAAIDQQIARRR